MVTTARVLLLGSSPQASEVTMLPASAVSRSFWVAPVEAFQRKTHCRSATARMLDLDQSSRFR